MLYTIVGNGCGETIYDKQVIEIEGATEEEVQAWGDAWREALPDDKIDCYGDLDFTKMTLEEVIAEMPKEWQVMTTGKQGSCLFL